MLVIVDMQNQILDPKAENYVKGAQLLIPKLKKRLEKAREKGEFVLFLKDIPIEYKDEVNEKVKLQIIKDLSPLEHEFVFEKHYFSLPPASLLKIEKLISKDELIGEIEVTGVELSLCVLSNIFALQSIFPEQDFYVNKDLVAGNKFSEVAFDLLEEFNVRVTK